MDKKKIFIIAGAVIVFLLVTVGIIFILNRKTTPTTPTPTPACDPAKDPNCGTPVTPIDVNKQVSLNIWGVFDDSITMQPLIEKFNRLYPNIKITFSKKDYADYETGLVDIIAAGEGPDIFAVNNYWIPKHRSKMSPADNTIMTLDEYSQTFIPSVYNDFVMDGKIYGLPLYTDNLVLFYNKTLFSKASIYDTPKYWGDVLNYSNLTVQKQVGNPNEIEVAGIALGTTGNVTRSSDILLAMMLQTATPMISDDKKTYTFNQFRKSSAGASEYPGTNALDFYTSFANPDKGSYSWNSKQPGAIDAFGNGKVAMILGYNYFIPLIEKINPQLSYGVAALPQIKGAPENTTVANYWGWSVSRNSSFKTEAWLFLKFLAEKENESEYLAATKRVSPRKDMRGGAVSVFEDQKAYTKTLFKSDSGAFDTIFDEMIDDITKYKQPEQVTIDSAARKANELLAKYY